MIFKKPISENDRLSASVIIVFIVYFGLNSLIFAAIGEDSPSVQYLMTFSFLGGMVSGVAFFIWSRTYAMNQRSDGGVQWNLEVLKRALSEDESLLIDMVSTSEGVTQDSLRFKTGFSKSKVSALLSEMEKKDLIVRENLGRTYKIFIADWLKK